jgi:hypothetical protein
MITASAARESFNYASDIGVLTWRVRPGGRVQIGDEAGSLTADGYLVLQFEGRRYLVHRVIWLWMTGDWPAFEVDHWNGSHADNRWSNLRDVQHKTNTENRQTANSNNSTGFLGVSRNTRGFVARIRLSGKSRCLGTFETPQAAHDAYLAAKREVHAGCTI